MGRHLGFPGRHRPLAVLVMSCSLTESMSWGAGGEARDAGVRGGAGGRGGVEGGPGTHDCETPALSSQVVSLSVASGM